jgi:hypothetical protein
MNENDWLVGDIALKTKNSLKKLSRFSQEKRFLRYLRLDIVIAGRNRDRATF